SSATRQRIGPPWVMTSTLPFGYSSHSSIAAESTRSDSSLRLSPPGGGEAIGSFTHSRRRTLSSSAISSKRFPSHSPKDSSRQRLSETIHMPSCDKISAVLCALSKSLV